MRRMGNQGCTLSIALFVGGMATAQVVPADRQNLEGNASSIYPLGRFNARVQQLHKLPSQPGNLSGHAYRRDATNLRGRVDSYRTELEVQLSITTVEPAAASSTFAQNVGATVQTVLPRSFITFPATDRPSIDPAPSFAFVVPYNAPFSWPGAGTLCVDVLVHGNDTPSGRDRNFLPELDAHDLYPDGRNVQAGYAYGNGCAAPGRTATARLSLVLTQLPNRLDLAASLTNAVPSDNTGQANSALLLGLNPADLVSPWRSECRLYVAPDLIVPLPNTTDSSGAFSANYPGVTPLPVGMSIYGQMATLHRTSNAFTLSDGVRLTQPPFGSTPISAVRIANGTDRGAATGSVANSVTVLSFF